MRAGASAAIPFLSARTVENSLPTEGLAKRKSSQTVEATAVSCWIFLANPRGNPRGLALKNGRAAGLPLQAAEESADDQGGVLTLLGALEPGQVPLDEGGQAIRAVADGVGGDGGVVQEGRSLRMIQERH